MKRLVYSSIILMLMLFLVVLMWKKLECISKILKEQEEALIKEGQILKERRELEKVLDNIRIFIPSTDKEKYEKVLAFLDSLSGFKGVKFKIYPFPIYGSLKNSYSMNLTAEGEQAITMIANFLYTQIYPILDVKEVTFKITDSMLVMDLRLEIILE